MFGLSFATPWILAALAVLPAIWWLLRVIPPSPQRIRFPALALLLGLQGREHSSARTPWWLILLRLVLAALLIVAAAGPLLNAQPVTATGPLLLVIDDGWAAAANWEGRRQMVDNAVARAERAGQPVILLPTAPKADGSGVAALGPMPAGEARDTAKALVPRPWPVDRAAAEQALQGVALAGLQVLWLADGVDAGGGDAFAQKLTRLGPLTVAFDRAGARPHVLLPPSPEGNELRLTVRRIEAGGPEVATVLLRDQRGTALAREPLRFEPDRTEATALLSLPPELRNRVARAEVENESSAAATALFDERWRRRPVGLIGGSGATPLLDGLYYVERALGPTAELRRGGPSQLLERELSMIVLADAARLTEDEHQRLTDWVKGGGLLVRFAGPQLSRAPDDLLPVSLRTGGRTLGGTLSWSQPMALAGFPQASPFAGLVVPPDVTVSTQVLAEPSPDLAEKTWARLSDGTPLVTSAALGKGRLVLVHTSADPAWSNLPMSGLFVEMLRRLVDLSQGVATTAGAQPLPPLELLDGFGRLTAPYGAAGALVGPNPQPGPRTPPGYYGQGDARRAFNLGPALPPPRPLAAPLNASVAWYGEQATEQDLAPWLLYAALLLAVIDFAAGLALRGLLGRPARALGLALLLGLGLQGRPAEAQDAKAALQTRLAYVVTGDAAVDRTSQAGLSGLARVVSARSTASLSDPVGIDLARDELLFFPIIYWPLTPGQGALAEPVRAKVNDYMRNGGLILFDGRDGGMGDAGLLSEVAQGLAIPPLAPVAEDHVLTRSFYLLRGMPGRSAGGQVWIGREEGRVNDGVSPVVIGGNDWAAAWAVDGQGRPMFAVSPGGEQQREMAFRFGVNLVMYALTGNYKADQVHLPAILERLRR